MRPTAGARLAVVKAEETSAAVIYRGHVHTPERDLPVEITVALPGGATRAALAEGELDDLEKSAAALVRAATRAAVQAGTPLPRKIVRWRE